MDVRLNYPLNIMRAHQQKITSEIMGKSKKWQVVLNKSRKSTCNKSQITIGFPPIIKIHLIIFKYNLLFQQIFYEMYDTMHFNNSSSIKNYETSV